MGPQSIREYTASLSPQYRAADRPEKTRLLDEVCRITGRHRKSAIRRLGHPPKPPRSRGGGPPRYGSEVVALLRRIWEASDYLCGKRLAPFLEPLVEALERHHELCIPPAPRPLLLQASPATIDRLLRAQARAHPRRLATNRPSHPALAAQVPIRTFGDWQGVRPGTLPADLVAHCGERNEGFYLTSLVAVDVATAGPSARRFGAGGSIT